MSIPTVGCDAQGVGDVSAALDRFGARYLARVLHPSELGRATGPSAAEYVAGRFAAKEAVFKTLRAGAEDALPWPDIEIATDGAGPLVRLHGRATTLAARARVTDIQVSISHTEGFAFAVAVAMTADPTIVAAPSA